jgi:hypothetical protein
LLGGSVDVEQSIVDLLLNKETVFFALFLYLFYAQQQEKKDQNTFILKQQEILGQLSESVGDLGTSFEKMADNQEKLTGRIEKIEVNVENILQEKDE